MRKLRKAEKKRILKKNICFCLLFALSLSIFFESAISAQASAPAKLQLRQAQSLACANSLSYQKLKSKLALKKVSYKSAMKSIKMKKKNLSTIRYSPLLSLQFPDQAMAPDEVEFIYKPLQIQSEIASVKHEMKDELLAIKEEVSNLYVETYTLQEQVKFGEERLKQMKEALARNEAKLLLGEASPADVERIRSSVSALEGKTATDSRKLLAALKKLGKKINMDISTGYELKNPYQESSITRESLPDLIDYTLDNDHAFYQTKADTSLALLSLDTNYNIVKGKYGAKANTLAAYVNMVKQGYAIDGDALKIAYDQFLIDIDQPWEGSFSILFIKIPKEWLKGSTDGSRFIQDDPYALYTCILEYQDALKEQEKAEEELISQVEDGFENLITVKNAYEQLDIQAKQAEAELTAATYQNLLGEFSYEELSVMQEEYASLQIDVMDALSMYTQTLFSYNRLTCGAITQYMLRGSLELDEEAGGNSYLVAEEYEGLSYYIKLVIEDYAYELGIYVPDNFIVEVTDFELWCGGKQIGERTSIDKTIKHLVFSMEEADKIFVRFYNGEEFVDDCEINPEEYSGPLTLTEGYSVTNIGEEAESAGSYQVEENAELGTTTITLHPEDKEIAYYTIHDLEGKKIYSEEYIEAGSSFTYFSFAMGDLSKLQAYCYDAGKAQISVLSFDTASRKLKK